MRFRKGFVLALTMFVFALVVAVLGSCADEEYPLSLWEAQHPDAGEPQGPPASSSSSSSSTPDTTPQKLGPTSCRQTAAESYPARLAVMSADAGSSGTLIYVSDLLADFNRVCGSCHGATVESPFGGFQIASTNDFQTLMTADILAHITSNQTTQTPGTALDPMPPLSSANGESFDKRPDGDPVKVFANLVQEWLDDKSPASFIDTSSSTNSGPSYTLSTNVGTAMTNIGNCIPSKNLMWTDANTMDQLDAKFASATAQTGTGLQGYQMVGLPQHLSDTDLTSFDSAVLARTGVVAYAPAYPLWSDTYTFENGEGTGKLRYVRVPRGTSMVFDKATQRFDIPENTRFYKTFLKRVVDTDGSIRYRKIETRLIVARHDRANPSSTATCQGCQALFGTYAWNDAETDAELVTDPLNNSQPFADRLIQYVTDEQIAAEINATNPPNPQLALINYGAARHYAIPSSERCVECHMGSPDEMFVLGFTPLQINRRPVGQGGIIEETGADELTQLQRLIDYGVITGLNSASDILPLEKSEGDRPPRNNYELIAQGYMVGNCAHCHNPRGFPSIQNPVLVNVLNFLPGSDSGIFQFPLERYSPRIFRSQGGSVSIPYITPSLTDVPPTGWNDVKNLGNASWSDPDFGDVNYNPKWSLDPGGVVQLPDGTTGLDNPLIPGTGTIKAPVEPSTLTTSVTYDFVAYAPWRSLIYRNVSTPFTYQDDLALFPHMPFNTPGFDCNLKQIMADWMVSIPAVRKNPEIDEYALPAGPGGVIMLPDGTVAKGTLDANSQPYVEVKPGDPRYQAAYNAAQERLNILHTGNNPRLTALKTGNPPFSTYDYCPTTSDDILDPYVEQYPACLTPSAIESATYPSFPGSAVAAGGVPVHAHWVTTDQTEPPGAWSPRRTDWTSVLAGVETPGAVATPALDAAATTSAATCPNAPAASNVQVDQEDAINALQSIYLTDPAPQGSTAHDVRSWATTAVPFGLWENKPGCNFSSQPKAQSFTGASRPTWMDNQAANVSPTSPVYMQSPGGAIFNMICINCHGPKADGTGRIALSLLTMTGGTARVADLRDGLFGPTNQPEANLERVFAGPGPVDVNDAGLDGGAGWNNASPEDRASRYMAWMALGGTQVRIPQAILDIVGDTSVFGVRRILSTVVTANMLAVAKGICRSLLTNTNSAIPYTPYNSWYGDGAPYLTSPMPDKYTYSTLISTNGDAELWFQLCSLNNPPPVHVVNLPDGATTWWCPGSGPFTASANSQITPGSNTVPQGSVGQYFIPQSAYGSGPVGNDRGTIDPSLQNDLGVSNRSPWCIAMPATAAPGNASYDSDSTACASSLWAYATQHNLPVCPANVVVDGRDICTQGQCWNTKRKADETQTGGVTTEDPQIEAWAVRGAINAGLSVFSYLDAVERGQIQLQPTYDACEQLN